MEYGKKVPAGGTRSVASGHDDLSAVVACAKAEAWPSKGLYSVFPSSQHSSEVIDKLE